MSVAYVKRIGTRLAACAVAMILGGLLVATPSRAADPIGVVLDEARLVKVPERATTIILGNPLIADVAIQPGGVMLVTGKGHGATSITVLDRSGTVVMDRMIEVTAQTDRIVTVHRGVERYSYTCLPECQPRAVLGDTPDHFGGTMGQITARAGAVSAMTNSSAQPVQ
jgi:hypothetical protein